ncbi:MAG: tRNA (adenosine(37)-N6)-threonylcarbamoyltransferase complex ATPase subunit type 1 TsaE [Alphaproteobacteria bacterium]|nr:tRNA (adenosine(37)-N6)-threonylcarbamoyltransferase complex ATPase subunit type 1 TsaE [Alphaproteobacteria bacterium]
MEIHSHSEADTQEAAQALAKKIKAGDVLALHGDLGMGKSVFARALIRALIEKPDEEVPSPTFTLVQTYDSAQGPLYHFDCYRIEDPEEIYELGWEEALESGIIILEWPSRIAGILPTRRLDITLAPLHNNPEHRLITINRVE